MARPKAEINEKHLKDLISIGATNCELADIFGVNETTIRNRFSEILAKGRSEMKQRLRKAQWNSAMSGNVVMQIWLGKQMLKQSENPLPQDEDNEFTFE